MTYIPPTTTTTVTSFEDLRLQVQELRDWIVELVTKHDVLKTTEKTGALPFEWDYFAVTSQDSSGNPLTTVYRIGGATGSIVGTVRCTYDASSNLLSCSRTLT